ncbi:MAG: TRAP transporter small permease [Firmicutes bacterium]|nr:TRAP transporter small permease [Bacillota bacterium]
MLAAAAGLCIATLIAVVFANVFFRYVLHAPIPWAEEVARYTMVYMAYLAAPLALREGRHIRITIVTDRLRGKWAVAADVIAHAAILVLSVVVVANGMDLIQLVSFQRSPSLRMSMSIPYFSVVIGAAFLAVEAALLLISSVARLFGVSAGRGMLSGPGGEEVKP